MIIVAKTHLQFLVIDDRLYHQLVKNLQEMQSRGSSKVMRTNSGDGYLVPSATIGGSSSTETWAASGSCTVSGMSC